MDYTNTEVALTINIGGAQALRGSYEFKQTGIAIEKAEDGTISKFPVGALVTKQYPVFHEDTIRTTLKNDFVNFAIIDASLPQKAVSARYWQNLSKKNRLKYHIESYVRDLYGDAEFTYEIME
jgi:hypothetical protein